MNIPAQLNPNTIRPRAYDDPTVQGLAATAIRVTVQESSERVAVRRHEIVLDRAAPVSEPQETFDRLGADIGAVLGYVDVDAPHAPKKMKRYYIVDTAQSAEESTHGRHARTINRAPVVTVMGEAQIEQVREHVASHGRTRMPVLGVDMPAIRAGEAVSVGLRLQRSGTHDMDGRIRVAVGDDGMVRVSDVGDIDNTRISTSRAQAQAVGALVFGDEQVDPWLHYEPVDQGDKYLADIYTGHR